MMEIGELIVIAGPSCAGKTTIAGNILSGDLPLLSEQLGIYEPLDWKLFKASKLIELDETTIEKAIVRYDITQLYFQTKYGASDTPAATHNSMLKILETSAKKELVTLYPPAGTLIHRLKKREIPRIVSLIFKMRFWSSWNRFNKLSSKIKVYSNNDELQQLYGIWFDFTTKHGSSNQWIINNKVKDYKLIPMQKWLDSG